MIVQNKKDGVSKMIMEVLFKQFPTIKSDRLCLRKIVDSDFESIYEIYSNPKVFKYCGIISKKSEDTVRKMILHFDRDFKKKKRIKWGICYNSNYDKIVGIIEAFDFKPAINMVTVGYFLNEKFWGQGIATEALRILVEFLFNQADLNRIQAEVMLENDISKKVLYKNNFIKEGTLRQANIWSGKGIVDLDIFSILKEDYLKQKQHC